MKSDDRLATRDKAVRTKLFCNDFPHAKTVSGVEVELVRDGDGLALDYFVHGDIRALNLPERAPAGYLDYMASRFGEQTSFEIKVAGHRDVDYYEYAFNFAGGWTSMQTGGYYETLQPDRVTPPTPDVSVSDELLRFSVRLAGEHLPALPPDRDWRAAVSLTIEEDGACHWFVLRPDPPLGPEFPHDPSILVLPPPNVLTAARC